MLIFCIVRRLRLGHGDGAWRCMVQPHSIANVIREMMAIPVIAPMENEGFREIAEDGSANGV